MTNDYERPTLLRSALSVCVTARARCVIAALMMLHAAPVQAQAAGEVLRPWNCLTNSVVVGSLFGTPVTAPGCTVPGVTWPGPRPASAIIPPGSPMGLAATVTGHTVMLTWTSPTAGGTPTSYFLQAGSASGLANLVSAGTESELPTLTATNVPNGTYFFRVFAQNASGTSVASNEISVRVGAGMSASAISRAPACIVPPPPTSLSRIQSGSSVTFIWAAGEGECQAFALPDAYMLDYGVSPGATLGSLTLPNQPTTVTVSLVGVGAGTYYIRVRALNANGSSGPSNEVILRIGGVCNRAPLPPANFISSVAGSTVVFSWDEVSPDADTPTGYRVSVGIAPGSTLVQIGASTNVYRTTVPAGNYYARVEGVNACGASAVSNEINVVVGGPAVPVVVTAVHQFVGAPTDGANRSTLMQARDGNFYGTSVSGGAINPRCVANLEGCGVIFKMTPAGTLTILYVFGSNGSSPVYPYSRLLQASDGTFWGTTTGQEDGNGAASVYKMAPNGTVTFVSELGGPSYSSLMQGTDGSIYGTTVDNGAGPCSWRSTSCLPTAGSGTIFKVTSAGTLTYLHVFNGADGAKPYGGLLQASDGMLYGTTSAGGAKNFGTIYRITPDGTFTTVYTFTGGADGANPAYSNLIQASDGNLFGTTQFGGGTPNAGTVFRMTLAGAFSVLHPFTGVITKTGTNPPASATDGLQPGAGLIEATDGRLYGVTGGGGPQGGGTAFMVTKDGTYTQLYGFGGSTEGGSPTATLIQATDGNLWGTGQYGGTFNRGVIFKMTLPR